MIDNTSLTKVIIKILDWIANTEQKGKPALEIPENFSFQGHRGARGLVPENTIPSFIKCLELGYPAFELDVVITGDQQVLVSHEAWFNSLITTKPDGKALTKAEAMSHSIFEMSYEEIKEYDVGRRGHPLFPKQVAMAVHKPLLKEVIEVSNAYAAEHGLPTVWYNLEVKSFKDGAEGYGKYNPEPDVFADLVYDVLADTGIRDQVIVQSFDPNVIQAMHQIDGDIPISMLVDNQQSFEDNLKRIDFKPDVYAPYYKLIDEDLVKQVHGEGIQIVTWTVNKVKHMKRLIRMGVDGVISDYPDKFIKIK